MELAMGQYDVPQKQSQPVFLLDLYRNNVAVFGGPMSGKTTFIKTLLVRISENSKYAPFESVYLIDLGGNIGKYSELKNVCCCVDNSNEEDIKRVFKTIKHRLEENTDLLASQSYCNVADQTPQEAPGHMTLIIENINAFLSETRYNSYQDLLLQFCRDGLSKGLTVIITGNDLAGTGRFLANFGKKIAFEMSSESYMDFFGTRVDTPMRLPGRGMINCAYGVCEFQCFLPFPTLDDGPELEALLLLNPRKENPYRIEQFPKVLTWSNLEQHCLGGLENLNNSAVVGLDYYEHRAVTVDFNQMRSIAIYGKRGFGKLNLLQLLLKEIRLQHPDARYVFLDDGRKRLEQISPSLTKGLDLHKFSSVSAFRTFLKEHGYDSTIAPGTRPSSRSSEEIPVVKNPFSVFVIQSKAFYRGGIDSKYLLSKWLPEAVAEAEAKGYILLFSDIPQITDADMYSPFNDSISISFLLDNLVEFIEGRGKRSVLSEVIPMDDPRELKQEYARCTLGDGYVYDVNGDELKKVKFIKA